MKKIWICAAAFAFASNAAFAAEKKFFISVDLEGIGGIGSSEMTRQGGKDYALGRELATAEVNTVVAAIYEKYPDANLVVNDSHGDHRNLYHTKLDPKVRYIQGDQKIYGMVEGLDASFDGVFYVGYHAKAGVEDGFLAHTGSGSVRGLWINGIEVGEGGMNAALAGAYGVPILFGSGDHVFTQDIAKNLKDIVTVATKESVSANAALLTHPDVVRVNLAKGVHTALDKMDRIKPFKVGKGATVRMQVSSTIRADVLMAIPNMKRIDGTTVEYEATDMMQAYPLIRAMYKFMRP